MKRVLVPLALLLVLAFGVGDAGGRPAAITTITVQIIGKGRITSENPSGISCGDGRTTCYLAFSAGSGTITLRANDSADDWHFDAWDGSCSGNGDTCDLSGSSSYNVTANFAGPPTPTSTLSVSYTGSGNVSGPETVAGTEVNCGSAPAGTDCQWSALTGSTLTVFETPGTTASSSTVGPGTPPSPVAGTSLLAVSVTGDGTVAGGGITCGSGGSVCSVNEVTGSTVNLTATPDSGATFTGWGGACSGTGICSLTMSGALSVTATFSVGAGTGSVFSGWGGDCTGTSVACTVELDQNRAVNATWTDASAGTKNLSVTVSGSGTVSGRGLDCSGPATCSAEEPVGSTVTLTAAPKEGYAFTGWTGTGSCTGTGATCTLTMDIDRSVTATFTSALPLTVQVSGNGAVTGGTGSINCGNGATVCSATFALNATVTLVATPATGATFDGWSGSCGGTATTCTVLMSAAKTVAASFTGGAAGGATGFTLSVAVTGNGTVSGGGINCGVGGSVCTSPNHAANSTVTLTASPSGGATFTGWGGACSGTTPTCTVVMSSAKSVSATFQGGTASVQLSVAVTGSGRVTGGGISCGNGASTCSAGESVGSTVTLTATPATGATFTGWGGACSGTAKTCAVTMSAAKSVTAAFSGSAPGTLTLVVAGRGSVSTSAGSCASTGPRKTCVQSFRAGAKATLTATPQSGASFLGWTGGCTGSKRTCTVTLTTAKSVTARFSGGPAGPPTSKAGLTSLGSPAVTRAGTGFRVTLRFTSTVGGLARVRGLRAGRVASSLSLRIAAGKVTVGPFPVAKPGLYIFELRLAGRVLRWRACLGLCGAEATAAPFVLTRESPTVTRSGDVWSVTLHAKANQISDARIRVLRAGKLLVSQRFLGRATRIALGPFLLGPGSYTLTFTATDPYGRKRILSWIVALAA